MGGDSMRAQYDFSKMKGRAEPLQQPTQTAHYHSSRQGDGGLLQGARD